MSVVTKDYENLQKEIINMQTEWKQEIQASIQTIENPIENTSFPLINQIKLEVSIEKYQNWIVELIDYLASQQPDSNEQFEKLKSLLNKDLVEKWIQEVLAFNEYYFQQFANDHKLATWLPYFLAEHAIRPYLRAVSKTYEALLEETDAVSTCPCCGEPIRLAILEGKAGRKVIHCPRCYAKWQEKRSKCSYCGENNDEKLTYLHVEGDSSQQIHVCKHCNGYIKVIDGRERMKTVQPALLDLKTIHLDIIAQERGFGMPTTNETNLM